MPEDNSSRMDMTGSSTDSRTAPTNENRCLVEQWQRDEHGQWAMRRCGLEREHGGDIHIFESWQHYSEYWRHNVTPLESAQADPARVQSSAVHPEIGSATQKGAGEAAGDALRQLFTARAEEARLRSMDFRLSGDERNVQIGMAAAWTAASFEVLMESAPRAPSAQSGVFCRDCFMAEYGYWSEDPMPDQMREHDPNAKCQRHRQLAERATGGKKL